MGFGVIAPASQILAQVSLLAGWGGLESGTSPGASDSDDSTGWPRLIVDGARCDGRQRSLKHL